MDQTQSIQSIFYNRSNSDGKRVRRAVLPLTKENQALTRTSEICDLPELAENDGEDEEYEDGDDGDGNYPVRSHPIE